MDKSTLKKLFELLKKQLPMIIISLILAALTVALTLYIPVLVGDAIDCIIGEGEVDFEAISHIAVKMAIAIVLTVIFQWIMSLCNNHITFGTVRTIRERAFMKLQRLPLSYMDSHPYGDTVSRMIADADTFADGLLLGFTQLFSGVVTIIGTVILMFRISPLIALIVIVLTPISLLVAKFIATRTYDMFKLQSETRGEQTAFIDERVGNQKVVQAFLDTDESLSKFNEINERLRSCSLRAIFFSSMVNPSTRVVNSIIYAVVCLAGAFTAIANPAFTVGMLSCLLSYASQYSKPFNEISGVVTELQNAFACVRRIFELLDETEEVSDAGLPELGTVSGAADFSDVSFSYTKERPLIEHLELKVVPGKRIAIVGPTGCGKTTLINLIMRFYDVTGGAISIDGTDIRSVTRHSLRGNYGMVLQETWLRSGTVRENITMGAEGISDEQIVAAAKATHAHDFIKRLPNGYDTVIGDENGSLSEGQKQLLCITRVMLAPPPVLILDEATSCIDARTEIDVQNAFSKLMEGRTSFVVAHRLSTIRSADVILVMQDGHIIEQGNHSELLAKQGFYYRLYNSQFADT